MIKANPEKGIPWRFGHDWQGQRCDAMTRKGTACQKLPLIGKARCRLHGGLSTGPKTPEGKGTVSRLRIGSTEGGLGPSLGLINRHGRNLPPPRAVEARMRADGLI